MVAVNLPCKRENRFDIHNEREFKRVEGLELENWADDG
jgi:hypothetical protein